MAYDCLAFEHGQRSRPCLVSQKSRGSEGKYEMNINEPKSVADNTR